MSGGVSRMIFGGCGHFVVTAARPGWAYSLRWSCR